MQRVHQIVLVPHGKAVSEPVHALEAQPPVHAVLHPRHAQLPHGRRVHLGRMREVRLDHTMVAAGLEAVVAARERALHIAVDVERVDPDRVRVHVTERLHLAIGERHLHERSHRELGPAVVDERNQDLLVAGDLVLAVRLGAALHGLRGDHH